MKIHCPVPLSVILVGMALGTEGSARQADQTAYTPPVLDEIPFDPAKIKAVDEAFLKQVGEECTILARNIVMSNAAKAKMLAVALGLNPGNKAAKSANDILSRGERPPPLNVTASNKKPVSNELIYKNLHADLKHLINKVNTEDEKMLAAMLYDALADIEKDNDQFRRGRDRFREFNKVVPPWDRILGRNGKAGTTPRGGGLRLKSGQSRVKANGARIGGVFVFG